MPSSHSIRSAVVATALPLIHADGQAVDRLAVALASEATWR
ncbi:hypothetical protein [Xanthomonas maliensis]|nr:hypothetical protein [Xanthomonas maliensis]